MGFAPDARRRDPLQSISACPDDATTPHYLPVFQHLLAGPPATLYAEIGIYGNNDQA